MMKSKMRAKCISSGETPKTWKRKPIQAAKNEMRKARSSWNASKKPSASSLAHTQTRNPSAFILLFLLNIRKSKSRKIHLTNKKRERKKEKKNPFSFITYHNDCNSSRRDDHAINNIISFTLNTNNLWQFILLRILKIHSLYVCVPVQWWVHNI